MEQLIKLRKKNNTLLAPKWCLQALGNPNYFKISIENNRIVYIPLVADLILKKAQHLLWSMLTDDERTKHIMAYKTSKTNLENGIDKIILDSVKVENNAPAALYFDRDESLDSQPNVVGQVLHKPDGNVIVIFQSEDIVELLELYYGDIILVKR